MTQAVILCGGKGTRLRPITYEIPKPLLPVQGRSILDWTIELLNNNRIYNIMLLSGYKSELIKKEFTNRFGISIIVENEPMGTAGVLRKLKGNLDDTFFVLNGDNLININLGHMLKFHERRHATATIALRWIDDVSNYGAADHERGKIIGFYEKQKTKANNLHMANAGVYIFESKVLDLIPDNSNSLEYAVFPSLAGNGELYGYEFDGQWFPCDTFREYSDAISLWKGYR